MKARLLLTAALLSTTLLAAAAPAAQATHTRACASSQSTTVVTTKAGRFFTKKARSAVAGRHRFRRFYSCSYRYGKTFRLIESGFEGEDRYGPYRMTPVFGGYVYYGSCGACESRTASIMVQNMRTGRHGTFVSSTGGRPTEAPDGFSQDVSDLELRTTGAVGWIVTERRFEEGSATTERLQVRAHGRAGDRLLDEGAGIDRFSLRLSGSTLSWVKDGERRSATLR